MKNKKEMIFKVLFLILGIYIFTLGLSLYLPTSVGVMHLDFTIYSTILALKGTSNDGLLSTKYTSGIHYELLLGMMFLILSLFSILFFLISKINVGEFKTDKRSVFRSIFWILITDLVIVFAEPLFLMFHNHFYITQKVAQYIQNQDYQIRLWIFLLGFILNALGDALWIKSSIFLGPYNLICTNYQKLTKWNYISSRILIDFAIMVPGIIIALSTTNASWSQKSDFFLNYLNIGTIAFIFLFGPFVHTIVHFMEKITLLLQGKRS